MYQSTFSNRRNATCTGPGSSGKCWVLKIEKRILLDLQQVPFRAGLGRGSASRFPEIHPELFNSMTKRCIFIEYITI